jgi:hypothetical protein
VSHSAALIGYARNLQEPIADSIAPNNRMPGLIFEAPQNFLITILIDSPFQGLPLRHKTCRSLRAFVVRIVDVLDDRLPRMQDVCVGYVVKE